MKTFKLKRILRNNTTAIMWGIIFMAFLALIVLWLGSHRYYDFKEALNPYIS